MLRKISKKGESLSTNKIITIVLVLVVLAAVLLYVFRVKVNEWVQNLPGYGSQEDEELDYSQLPPEEQAKYNCEKVGHIVDEPRSTWAKVGTLFNLFGGASDYVRVYIKNEKTGTDEKTDILWYYDSDKNPANGPLELDEAGIGGNEAVGSVNNRVFFILISNWDESAERGGHNIPSIESLELINGAKKEQNTNDLVKCKPLENE